MAEFVDTMEQTSGLLVTAEQITFIALGDPVETADWQVLETLADRLVIESIDADGVRDRAEVIFVDADRAVLQFDGDRLSLVRR